MIQRTATADTIRYARIIHGAEVAFLDSDASTRKVVNVETADDYLRQGLARSLWDAANAEAECFHAVDHHRTSEGDAFAHAVGGETIEAELDHIDECGICCSVEDDNDDDWM